MHEIAFRLSDVAGKSYAFEELVLAQRGDSARLAPNSRLACGRLYRRYGRGRGVDPVCLGRAGLPPRLCAG